MACGKLGTFFLVGLNIIFFLLGLGIMVVGIMLKVDSSLVDEEIKPLLNQVQFNGYDLGDLMEQLSTFVICVGVFILIISALGLIGVCCRSKIVLVIYAIIVLILLIAEIASIALFAIAKDEVEAKVKEEFVSILNTEYEDDTLVGVNELTRGWNILFITMDCCGVNAFETTNDFETSTWWSSADRGSSKIPVFCCKKVTQTNFNDTNFQTGGADASCHENPTSAEAYTTLGCYQAVVDEVTKYSTAAIGVGATILVIQLLSIVFAFCLCKEIGKDEVV